MRTLSLVPLLLAALLTTACDDDGLDDPVFIYHEGARFDLVGIWSGMAEITTAEDIGSNVGLVGERGFTFPVVLRLHTDRTFELITANFPTSYNDDTRRTCAGAWVPEGTSVSFFSVSACRALPFSRYSVGRVLPFGIMLQASTSNGFNPSNASIRVQMRLTRD